MWIELVTEPRDISNALICWTIAATAVAETFFSQSEIHADLPPGTQVPTFTPSFSFLDPIFVVGTLGSLGCTLAIFLVEILKALRLCMWILHKK